MLAKILHLISTAKVAAAAGVIVAAGVTTGVVATNEDAQNAIGTTIQNVAQTVTGASPAPKDAESGQPAVVAARNDADKKLRGAFQDDQQKLEKLHSTKVEGDDRGKLADLIKDADAKLRARLTKSLDDVAALTLGREGRESSPPPAGLSPASGPATLTASAKSSPDVKIALTAETQAKIDGIVKTAIADMDKIVADAEKAVAALPTFTPGKPSDAKPGEKRTDAPGGKPSDAPGGKPATPPGRP